MADNTTLTNHFSQDPWNPITRPITNRRRRHALLVASNENKQTHDPIEVETNKIDLNSNFDDHFERYDVEAIEIDSGISGVDTDEDEEFYGDGTVENDGVDEKDDPDEHQDEEDQSALKYWDTHPKDLSTARWTLFKGIEMLAHRFVAQKIFFFENLLVR